MTSVRKAAVLSLFVFGLLSLTSLCFISNVARAQTKSAPPLANVVYAQLEVEVLDINTAQGTADINMNLIIAHCPYNVSSLSVLITGNGIYSEAVTCNNMGHYLNGPTNWYFQGQLNNTSWNLDGFGENYPFDTYTLNFWILGVSTQNPYSTPFSINCSLAQYFNSGVIYGPNLSTLSKSWVVTYSDGEWALPTSWEPVQQIISGEPPFSTLEMVLSLTRTANVVIDDALEFLVPILATYFLLLTTLMIPQDPSNLGNRLTIYLALFVFVPTFLFTIQTYLPYRTSLSFPELLLTNLIISTTFFGIFSIIGNRKIRTSSKNRYLRNFGKYPQNWDLIAVILSLVSLMFFIITFFSTLSGEVAPATASFFAVLVVAFCVTAWTLKKSIQPKADFVQESICTYLPFIQKKKKA